MRAVITRALVAKLKPGDYTVFDKTERGLALRVLASGVKTWRVGSRPRTARGIGGSSGQPMP